MILILGVYVCVLGSCVCLTMNNLTSLHMAYVSLTHSQIYLKHTHSQICGKPNALMLVQANASSESFLQLSVHSSTPPTIKSPTDTWNTDREEDKSKGGSKRCEEWEAYIKVVTLYCTVSVCLLYPHELYTHTFEQVQIHTNIRVFL